MCMVKRNWERNRFSYEEYLSIMEAVRESGKQATFEEALHADRFVIMRHDVEFSVKRAYALAKYEHAHGFKSIYFFQISNNTYNLFSGRNLDYVGEILRMGHQVGLHFHLRGGEDLETVEREIREDVEILQKKVHGGSPIFSFHRPTKEVLSANIKMDGILNAYQDDFFSYTEDMEKHPPTIKYISDARHRFNYGLYPDTVTLNGNDKVHILLHPYSWTQEGYDNLGNFRSLIDEKRRELLEDFDSECKHFAEVRDAL